MSLRLALGLGPSARTTAGTGEAARRPACLAMPAWLTLTLMFTFVRYGVRDQARLKSRRPKRELSPYAGLH